jgi:hypothetical protein
MALTPGVGFSPLGDRMVRPIDLYPNAKLQSCSMAIQRYQNEIHSNSRKRSKFDFLPPKNSFQQFGLQ